MVDTGIFATTAEVQRKVGYGANSTANAEAYTNDFMTQAESRINVETHYNWSDKYAALNADVKGILKEAASNLAAVYVISYDWRNFSSKVEAQGRIDTLLFNYNACIKLLKEQVAQDFIKET
jgi:hypothetical protein